MMISPIQNCFAGSTVLVTGATGFLGKCLLEKLLRSCPEIQRIYILVREKKGKNASERVDKLLQDVIFSKLKENIEKFREKIVAIGGDISLPDLGLSYSDRAILQNQVNIVFHVAATVNFNEKLNLALAINVNGTKLILDLCRGMEHLKSVVYVSTAYSNCHLEKIEETFYKCPITHDDLNHILEKLDEKAIEELTPRIIGDWPNTYTFTKALAESLVKQTAKDLPLAIFRPAIVVSTWKEPIRGWIDNVYGPNGIVFGAIMGVLGSLHVHEGINANIVPVDMTVNALIATAWDTARKYQRIAHLDVTTPREIHACHNKEMMYQDPYQINNNNNNLQNHFEPTILNYVSCVENPITWSEFCGINQVYAKIYPFSKSLWATNFDITTSYGWHMFYMVFLHLIPAACIDCGLFLIGKKPRLVKLYKKTIKFIDILLYFSTRDWEYTNKNVQRLWQKLDAKDKEIFPFSFTQMDWLNYFRTYVLGMRRYLCEDDDSTLLEARRKENSEELVILK